MAISNQPGPRSEPKGACQVVIIGEDEFAHAKAKGLCGNLAKRFWGEVDFECDGWLFSHLEEPDCATAAAQAAATASLLIFAGKSQNEMPKRVQVWIDAWVGERQGREGALISLASDEGSMAGHSAAPKQLYLRQVARRARMDFLSDLAHVAPQSVPESQEWFVRRADSLGAVMDDILRHTASPLRPPGLEA